MMARAVRRRARAFPIRFSPRSLAHHHRRPFLKRTNTHTYTHTHTHTRTHTHTHTEWHTASGTCAKIFDGVPMTAPGWTQFMTVAHGPKRVTNAATNETIACVNWCAPDHGPCICEATSRAGGVPHAPVWHSHTDDTGAAGGWSFYEVRRPFSRRRGAS